VQLVSDSGTQISEVEVNRATAGRVETNAFKVADAATAGRAADALVLLRSENRHCFHPQVDIIFCNIE
jgi:DNA polymerase-3 subunit delta